MHAKILTVLLALIVVGYPVAPAWVDSGVNLNYSAGNDMITFTVLSRTSTDINIQTFTRSTGRNAFPVENASTDSGQFWFDSSRLSTASTGSTIGDYFVTEQGKQTFAGKEWDSITLQSTLSGAVTRKVLDKNSGLLLKQTVEVAGAPAVTLVQYYVPGLSQPPAPPQQNNTPPSPPPANETTNATGPSPGDNETLVPPPADENLTEPPPETPPASESPAAHQKKPLCPSSFLLLAVVFVAIIRDRI